MATFLLGATSGELGAHTLGVTAEKLATDTDVDVWIYLDTESDVELELS